MNRNKIKLKYVLNLWKSLPEYPTKEDVLYEIKSFLVRDSRPGEFSHQTLNVKILWIVIYKLSSYSLYLLIT